ncbi:Astacin-like metalloendopeptidase [Strongyloides ratti]|uniref:Zinc metalloproteinase n=1 Tax=Strongyloides ratti TaxID=34506 RepID=A0A090LLW4_STRRB|nr:Astacin-like metalloendopeptidase [Strongyloides ratti]CEF68555.1 Astacin-like metalloendopeptidase [Strongyloides ratti]
MNTLNVMPFWNMFLIHVLLFIIITLENVQGQIFLRDPLIKTQIYDNEKIDENIHIRKRKKRYINDDKKILMGLTKSEEDNVKFYLEKINNLMLNEHTDSLVNEKNSDNINKNKFSERFKDSVLIKVEENKSYFEGDIVLFPDQAETLYKSALKKARRVKRKFIGTKSRRWDPKKPIYFSFDGSHSVQEQRIIELALEHWHNITCLNFIRRDDEPKGNRLVFTDVDGCASNVGRHPLGEPQYVSLAPECIRLGVIAHEVAHALGFWHEQSRPDRDYYVNVRWENIDRESKGQFLKEQPSDVDTANVPYDYGSIMHYRSKAFARYDDLFTINTYITDYQRTIGQRDQLSFNDIRLMNRIYCTNTCPRILPCQRGGYTDPRHCERCRCPDGFTGTYCDVIMPGFGVECGGKLSASLTWSKISSPNYPGEFKEGMECSWLLTAPKGQHIQFQFIGQFEMYCKIRHSLCMDYVEVRNSTDFANTGMRYCCSGTPKNSIISATEDMVVLFRSFYRGGKGFQAQFRAIPQPGIWGSWESWSACTASCGSCGTRRRVRKCFHSNLCPGNDSETEVCNSQPCKGICPRRRIEDTQCGGLLALLKGVECKTDKIVNERCDEVCCAGFSLVNGNCIR